MEPAERTHQPSLRPEAIPSANVVDLRPKTQRRTPIVKKQRRPFRFPAIRLPTFHLPSWRLPQRPPPRIAQTRARAALPKPPRPRPPALPRSFVVRRLSPFAVLTLLFLLPLTVLSASKPLRSWERRLSSASAAALSAFTDAGGALVQYDFPTAAERFASARARFSDAYSQLQSLRGFIRSVVTLTPFGRRKVQDSERLLRAGERLAAAGERLTQTLGRLLQPSTTAQPEAFPLAASFLDAADDLSGSIAEINLALRELEQVRPASLPRQYRQRFRAVQAGLPLLNERLAQAQQLIPFLRGFFGADGPREYLFLFENNAELRPGGGFVGSLALINFAQGHFSILDAPGRGPFAINDYFPKHLLPPQPILSIAPFWTLHDANWFADFPTSAAKTLWFYEQARGFPVDGVVALTPSVIERLLEVSGPISLPKYGVVVTTENFLITTQEQVEVTYDRSLNQPKQFVVDLIPVLLETISRLPADKIVELTTALDENLRSKNLLFWMKDAAQQQRAVQLGWSGALPGGSEGDYLGIVQANLGGGKTSRVLETTAALDVRLDEKGTENTLRLTFRHGGKAADQWTGSRYRGYVKVYLPAGSSLIEASGFSRLPPNFFFTPPADAEPDTDLQEIETFPVLDEGSGTRKTDEFGRTVFGNWIATSPGETQTVTLRYRVGVPLERRQQGVVYRLTVAKQPGATTIPLTVTVLTDRRLTFASTAVEQSPGTVRFDDRIDQDHHQLLYFR